jgi:cathepsin D
VLQQHTIFSGSNFEAIVGMAYPALAEPNVTPVFDEIMNQKLLESNLFAFYLSSKQDESAGLKSDLTLGYYDTSKFTGDIHWSDVKFKYMFGVQLDDIKIGGKALNICEGAKEGCLITFDSGTSLGSVPGFAYKKLIAGGYPTIKNIVECENKNKFGDLTYVINGKDFTLTPDEWMFDQAEGQFAQGGITKFGMGALGPQMSLV